MTDIDNNIIQLWPVISNNIIQDPDIDNIIQLWQTLTTISFNYDPNINNNIIQLWPRHWQHYNSTMT